MSAATDTHVRVSTNVAACGDGEVPTAPSAGPLSDVATAVSCYLARRSGREQPNGRGDSGGRWYPANTERRWCCTGLRQPSRAWPHSIKDHCRTLQHVAALFDVAPLELRREARSSNAGVAA